MVRSVRSPLLRETVKGCLGLLFSSKGFLHQRPNGKAVADEGQAKKNPSTALRGQGHRRSARGFSPEGSGCVRVFDKDALPLAFPNPLGQIKFQRNRKRHLQLELQSL